jgi:AraC family transcriptional regulator, dual regulator of chb operon
MAATLLRWQALQGRLAGNFHINFTQNRGMYHFPLHRHQSFCEWVYVSHGELQHRCNGRAFTQSAGCLCLIRERDCHELQGQDFNFVNLAFPLSWLRKLEPFWQHSQIPTRLFRQKHPPVFTIPQPERLAFEAQLRRLLLQGQDTLARVLFARFLLNTLLDYFCCQPVHLDSPAKPEWLIQTLHWLDLQTEALPSLPDILAHCGRCPEHVARSFQRFVGMPPSVYLTHKRLQQAASLLQKTNYSVLEILFASGFENASYFHRLFKKAYGCTPKTYRRKHAFSPYA